MKEQIIAAMLTLSLATGFIYSIEVLAKTNRTAKFSCAENVEEHCQNRDTDGELKWDCQCEGKKIVKKAATPGLF